MAVLTAASVAKLKSTAERRIIRDDQSRSLFLVIYPSGVKSWTMRFRKPNGAPAKLTLGPLDTSGKELDGAPVIGMPLSVAAARQLAAAVLRDRAKGSDVFAEHAAAKRRRVAEREQAVATAFGPLVRLYVAEHARPRTRRWRETACVLGLRYPLDGGEPAEIKGGLAQRWADKPITSFDGHDIHAVVDEARRRGTPGRSRRNKNLSDARGRHMARTLSKFFNWLLQQRLVTANPCAGVHVPPPGAARERVLSDDEIRWVWLAADKIGLLFGAAVKLLLLLGQRRNEVGGLERKELALDGLWTLPATRSKNRRAHTVPLPALARKIIGTVPVIENSPFIFSTNGVRPISGWSKAKALLDKEMLALAQKADPAAVAPPAWTFHDLRRTCATGLARLGVQVPVIEKVLNHSSGTFAGIVQVYQRHSFDAEKANALERWAAHVQGVVNGKRGGNVVPLRKRARA
jgi:integrase